MVNPSNQTWLAERYATAGAFVPVLGVPVLELLDAQAGERILDLGCGDGVLTEKIAAAAEVVAVDEIGIIPRPTVLTTDIEPWLDAFCENFLAAGPEPDRARARGETADLLRSVLSAEDGRWIADYVRLRFRARLTG